ncbi:MAG: hypothetical protein CL840_22105 [Crocinitomicaceae bacterium]|nr:hypothetical protein [Crocinitomicaceae bacterium]|tara:strand:- start:30624 stop:31583 length:960 start_codon:yes stop_codon:yes gene_type:complete
MILFLDEYPRSFVEQVITFCKIFLKEGVLHGSWREVFKNRKTGGSKSMPSIVKEHLPNYKSIARINELNATGIDQIYVFKDVLALEWALEQKKKDPKLKITAGPFIVNHPAERKAIVEDERIDKLVFFSQWHQELFKSFSEKVQLKQNFNWFCGVDTNYWVRPKNSNGKKVLVYSKTNPEVSEQIKKILTNKGIEFEEIVCGNYTPEQFKSSLFNSQLVIFVSKTETQGLAIFEAWSCNVPTFHFDPGVWKYQGYTYNKASSCPYLSDQLGRTFEGTDDFEDKFDSIMLELDHFTPRQIVENKFTIGHSMKVLGHILES